jgi:flavin-dependent dehydrogenase
MRVVICGGGVVGACTAYFLSRRGAQVIVVESTEVAGAASGKAGGLLVALRQKLQDFSLMVGWRYPRSKIKSGNDNKRYASAMSSLVANFSFDATLQPKHAASETRSSLFQELFLQEQANGAGHSLDRTCMPPKLGCYL